MLHKKKIILVLWVGLYTFQGFAQKKLNSAEEQIFKAEAVKVVERYYQELPGILSKLQDSVTVATDDEEGDQMKIQITYKQQFIEKYFDNYDIYVHNDLNPDDKPQQTAQRVMIIEDYLDEMKKLYKESPDQLLETRLKAGIAEQVGYNDKAVEPFYYAKIKVKRELKGKYLGKYYTENTRELNFYVKTIDKPDTKLKEFKIIGIDYESQEVFLDNLSVDEAIAKGMKFYNEMDYDKAFKYLLKHSEDKKFKKNSNATWALGYMYFWGRGTERSDEEMVKWLEYSAKKNSIYALYWLGENYYYGEYGVEEDEKKAFKMIKESARKGYAVAQYFLGEHYEKGEGLRQSNRKAIKWYKKAAAQGSAKAKQRLKTLDQ